MFASQYPPPVNQPRITGQHHHRETIWRILLDIISLIILIAITVITHFVAKPFTRGFFCSDTSIQYPNQDNTIPTSAAVILSIGLPIIWMWITEICKQIYFKIYEKQMYVTYVEISYVRTIFVYPLIRNLYMLTIIFFYGYLATWVLTEIAKNFVGELRPNFLAVCQPTYNCSAVTSLSQFHSYLQYGSNYTCQNTDDSAVRDARLQSTTQEISLLKLIFDGFSILLVFSPWLIFKYLVKPIRQSFLCSDLNLYHPKPIKAAVPTWLLAIYAVVLPVIIILCSEGVRWYYLVSKRAAPMIYKIQICSTIYNISQWIGNLYISLVVFACAHGVNSFLTNVGKVSVGRLRPHFIPSCFDKFDYTDFCIDPNRWISNYTCIGESSTVLKEKDGAYDIRQSFPSGHASTAFCGLMFLAFGDIAILVYSHMFWK
ncbi:unnamed protein product [Rotaria magnacalcarata]|uniref:Phosphatidic acid phosphatase type 2/haloperoxidase domain-containing protein n=1 Tax=Rotaria magnacalcarata TaxID=392030 RepID=A0A8S2QJC4_9BILA|nr:unnamed protein product [Rotaria magnacalcarata]